MLANLLPGLRELRAPLAAGYLFIVSGWILLHDQVNLDQGASSTVDAMRGLRDQLGTGALAAAITFIAYLIGALWEPLGASFERGLWRIRTLLVGRQKRHRQPKLIHRGVGRDQPIALDAFTQRPLHVRLSEAGWRQLWTVSHRLFSDIDEVVTRKLAMSAELIAQNARRVEQYMKEVNSACTFVHMLESELDGVDQDRDGAEHIRMAAQSFRASLRKHRFEQWTPRERDVVVAYSAESVAKEFPDTFAAAYNRVMNARLGTASDAWWIREAQSLVTAERPHELNLRGWPPLACEKNDYQELTESLFVIKQTSIAEAILN